MNICKNIPVFFVDFFRRCHKKKYVAMAAVLQE